MRQGKSLYVRALSKGGLECGYHDYVIATAHVKNYQKSEMIGYVPVQLYLLSVHLSLHGNGILHNACLVVTGCYTRRDIEQETVTNGISDLIFRNNSVPY